MARKPKKSKSEFDQKLLDLARVTRVVRGGRRFRFRATIAIGNRKGKVGVGMAKGQDVSDAIGKAVNKAKKSLITVNLYKGTIPHMIKSKFKSARVIMKPARKGRGIVVGGAVRQIVELAGIENLSAKITAKGNKINNAIAALKGLQNLKKVEGETNPEEKAKSQDQSEVKANAKANLEIKDSKEDK
jgi:small subunit ribosomal protein S5